MRSITCLILLLLSHAVSAVSCPDVFSNALGASGGKIELQGGIRLTNTGDHVLAADRLEAGEGGGHHGRGSGGRNPLYCDGAACTVSGTPAPSIAIARASVREDLKSSRRFTPGDYYFDEVDLEGRDTISLDGSGQVRIHVSRDLKLRDRAGVNVGGSALDLVFIVGGEVEISDRARVVALLYARDEAKIKDDARLTGALVAKEVKMEDSARVAFTPVGNIAINGLCTARSGGSIPSGILDFPIEVGEISVIDTYKKPEFTRVNFTQVFDTPPAVFTLPTTDGSNTAAHRIRNVSRTGFEITTVEPPGEDGAHTAMRLNYLAVAKGVHDLPNGSKLRVGTVSTRKVRAWNNQGGGIGWESIGFGDGFSGPPAVLAQVQGMNNEQEAGLPSKPSRPWLTTAVSAVTASGMKLALERSESITGSVNRDEEVAWLAAEPEPRMRFTTGMGEQILMEILYSRAAIKGWGTCDDSDTRIHFARPWESAPVVVASMNTRNGEEGDGGWLRRCRTSPDYVAMVVDEIRSRNTGDRNREHDDRERAGILAFSGNFVNQAVQLDHYRLLHDGQGMVGQPETVTIEVCRTADCSQLYSGSVTVTLSPADANTRWSGSGVQAGQMTFSGGRHTLTLERSAAGSIVLGLSAATPQAASGVECVTTGGSSCRMDWLVPEFVVDIPDQVAGSAALGSVTIAGCIPDYQSRTLSLQVAATYQVPASPGPAIIANGVSLPADGSEAAVPLKFNDNCSATLTVNYPEAGQIGLSLRQALSNGGSVQGSDSLVVYPAALQAVATGQAGVLLDATTAGSLPVQPAGGAFSLQVQALGSGGQVLTRYAPQQGDSLRGYLRRVAPLGGNTFDGSLSVSATRSLASQPAAAAGIGDFVALGLGVGEFSNGIYRYDGAAYTEVGAIGLSLVDADYLGHQVGAAETLIGRFVPAGFAASGILINRSQTSGCTDNGFTYLDEPFSASITLSALNAAGALTRNYTGTFAPLAAGDAGFAAMHNGMDLGARLQAGLVSLGPWNAGMAQLDARLHLARAASADGPFDSTRIGLVLQDADGVALDLPDMDVDGDGSDDHKSLGSTRLRYGRVALGNAHGSELEALNMPLVVQYWSGNGSGYLTHGDDDCSPLNGVTLSDIDTSDGLVPGDSCIRDDAGLSGAFACTPATAPADQYLAAPLAGSYRLVLSPPGAGKTGSLGVAVGVPAWLRFDWNGAGDSGPSARATFGIFNRETRMIYQREVR